MVGEYQVTFTGPSGYIDIEADSHDEAMQIASHLLSASNGYHEVQIEKAPP